MYGPVHKHLCEKYQNQNAVKIKSKFEELFTIKLSLLQSNKSKTVIETDGILEDENKSVKTIGTDSLKPGTIHSGAALNNVGKTSSKRLLLTGSFKFVPLFRSLFILHNPCCFS